MVVLRILKFLGWVFVPFVMIFVSWKQLGGAGKTLGIAWTLFFLIIVFIPSDDVAPMETAAPLNTQSTTTQTEKEVKPKEAAKPNLEVISHEVLQEEYATYITGVIKNNTNRTYGYVQVEINLYDEDGVQIGSTLDNLNNLEGGGSWRFKAFVLEDDVDSYKIKDVTGF